jgi:hypothetical protein
LFTDSAGNVNLGCGAYFTGRWIQFKWPESWAGDEIMRDITLLELVSIIIALFTWESHFKHKLILFRLDNMALVTIIHKRTSKSKSVMKLLPPLLLCTLHNTMQFKAVHINMIRCPVSFSDESVQESCVQCRSTSCKNPYRILEHHIKPEILFLLDNSLVPSTVKTYQNGLELLGYFRKEFGLKDIWPVPLQEIIFYISHLFKSGRSYSTVSCYLAGLSFHNKVSNFEDDNTQRLIVRKIKRSRSCKDTKLPITRKLLNSISSILPCFLSCLS